MRRVTAAWSRFPCRSVIRSTSYICPTAKRAEGGEDEIDEAAVEVGYYEGNGLQLNDVLREVVLLALPMQLVCNESCKGICPVCGQNRNQRECGCQTAAVRRSLEQTEGFADRIGQRN